MAVHLKTSGQQRAQDHVRRALEFEEQYRFDRAIECWRRAIAADSSKPEYHHALGDALRAFNRIEDAIAEYRKAVSLNPGLAASWCNLCACLCAVGQVDDAVRCGNEAVTANPKMAAAHNNLAGALLDAGEARLALAACARALQLEPNMAAAHRTTARALIAAGEHELAVNHLRIAIGIEPQSPEILVELGDALRQWNKLDDAALRYERALLIKPDSIEARLGQTRLHIMRGEHEKALQLADRVLCEEPAHVTATLAAAEIHQHFRRFGVSEKLLRQRLACNDLSPSQRRGLLFALGDALDKLCQSDQAWEAYQSANELKHARFDRGTSTTHAEALTGFFNTKSSASSSDTGGLLPIFIAGMPRSGTTLTEQIIASHPQVFGAGELGLIGRVIGRIEPLTGVKGPYPSCVQKFTPDHVESLRRFCLSEFTKLTTSHTHIVEKTPDNFLHVGMIRLIFPKARIIHCRRDPMDTCLSCFFHDFTGHHPYAYSLENLGFYYGLQERLMNHWHAIGEPVLTVDYERMVEDQDGTSRELIAFCGLPWDDRCVNFHANDRAVLTASREQVRQPIYKSSVQRWRNYEKHLEPLRRALDAGVTIV